MKKKISFHFSLIMISLAQFIANFPQGNWKHYIQTEIWMNGRTDRPTYSQTLTNMIRKRYDIDCENI